MLASILPEKCIACGLCQLAAPELFDYDDNGIVLFKQAPNETTYNLSSSEEAPFLAAYKECPTRAIVTDK